MRLRIPRWAIAGALTLSALAPASAQSVPLLRGPGVRDFSGVVTPWGYLPPRIPNHWIIPQYVIRYELPQPIFVRVPVVLEPRPVEQIEVKTLTLGSDSLPAEARVKPGTVVTWLNAVDRERTLVLRLPDANPENSQTTSRKHLIAAKGTFSLVLHQPGTYEYSIQEEPERKARLIVEE